MPDPNGLRTHRRRPTIDALHERSYAKCAVLPTFAGGSCASSSRERPVDTRCRSAADVDGRPLGWILLDLAKDFADNGSCVASTEENVADHVQERVSLRPFEVCMRMDAGGISHRNENRGDRVGCGRAVCAENAVPVDLDASYLEDFSEFGWVNDMDLEEDDVGAAWNGIESALGTFLLRRTRPRHPLLARLAMMFRRPSCTSDSWMKRRAVSSNSIRSARISVVRDTRDTSTR